MEISKEMLFQAYRNFDKLHMELNRAALALGMLDVEKLIAALNHADKLADTMQGEFWSVILTDEEMDSLEPPSKAEIRAEEGKGSDEA